MGLLPFKCGIDGCKKSKLQRHTHTFGELRNFDGDRQIIEAYRIYAEMRGEPMSIPGGSADDMNQYMVRRMGISKREAKKFRQQLEEERKNRKKR